MSGIGGIAQAQTSTGVFTESVDVYSTNPLHNSVTNGSRFQTEMTLSGSTFTNGGAWTNGDVWDTDFFDPQKAYYFDADGGNFDRYGNAISYYTGHGYADYGCTAQLCTSSTQCTSPPANSGPISNCISTPDYAPGVGRCCYNDHRSGVLQGNVSHHSNYFDISGGLIALGESAYSGPWNGAGTDGGVNLVIFDMSYGVSPALWLWELGPAFGGIHMYGTIMPVAGDTDNVADRGPSFAHKHTVNANGVPAVDWVDTLSSLTDGMACPNSAGYGGINGCGCNLIMSMDATTNLTDARVFNETWNELQADYLDATGKTSYFRVRFVCNYDSVTYQMRLP